MIAWRTCKNVCVGGYLSQCLRVINPPFLAMSRYILLLEKSDWLTSGQPLDNRRIHFIEYNSIGPGTGSSTKLCFAASAVSYMASQIRENLTKFHIFPMSC